MLRVSECEMGRVSFQVSINIPGFQLLSDVQTFFLAGNQLYDLITLDHYQFENFVMSSNLNVQPSIWWKCYFTCVSRQPTVVVFAYSFSGNPQHLFFFFSKSLVCHFTKQSTLENAKRTCITYISKVEVIKTLQPRPRHCDEI